MSNLNQIKLEVLYQACKVIGQALDLNRALREILNILAQKLNMARATIVLYDPEIDRLVIKASYGLNSEEEKKGIYLPGEGVTGQIFLSGEPCVVMDVSKEPLFLNKTGARKIKKENISFLAVPIKIEEQTIGVLSVDRLFNKNIDYMEDLRFLEIMELIIAQFVKLRNDFKSKEEKLRQENLILRNELKNRFTDFMAGSRNKKMQQVLEMIKRVAATKATVLLLGESGTGKTLTARLIHQLSTRADYPFVKINCAVLPENLLEAELFGYKRGAFTGAFTDRQGKLAEAEGGTIFLDEIGELSLKLQAKLLRFIQEKEFEQLGSSKTKKVDVRIITATNQELDNLVKKGKFREDLYFRLNVFPIYIPPLRERKEDLPLLVNFILQRLTKEYQRNIYLSPQAMEFLTNYSWPGNIRELENFLERLFIVADNPKVSLKDVSHMLKKTSKELNKTQVHPQITSMTPPTEPNAEEILEALKQNNYIVARAAKDLGMSFRQLRYRIKKLGLEQQIPLKRGRPALF